MGPNAEVGTITERIHKFPLPVKIVLGGFTVTLPYNWAESHQTGFRWVSFAGLSREFQVVRQGWRRLWTSQRTLSKPALFSLLFKIGSKSCDASVKRFVSPINITRPVSPRSARVRTTTSNKTRGWVCGAHAQRTGPCGGAAASVSHSGGGQLLSLVWCSGCKHDKNVHNWGWWEWPSRRAGSGVFVWTAKGAKSDLLSSDLFHCCTLYVCRFHSDGSLCKRLAKTTNMEHSSEDEHILMSGLMGQRGI